MTVTNIFVTPLEMGNTNDSLQHRRMGDLSRNKPSRQHNGRPEKRCDVSMNVAGKMESEEKMAVMDWNEFTQNTTFHGVKYIFEDSHFRLRR